MSIYKGSQNIGSTAGMKRVFKQITYLDLFKRIAIHWGPQAEEKLKVVTLEWRLKPKDEEDRILEALLSIH